MRWFVLAILCHTLVDFVAAALLQAFGHTTTTALLGEDLVCVFGLIEVWFIWPLRRPKTKTMQQVFSPPEKHAE
jgi:hypothetical protein